MKSTKYNFSKTQHSLVDTIPQQTRFYKNVIIPPINRQPITKKDNTFISTMENGNFIRSVVNNKNVGQFFQSQQIAGSVPSISAHNTSRQRFTPYPHYRRSYAHTVMQPINIRYYSYQSQLQQQQQQQQQQPQQQQQAHQQQQQIASSSSSLNIMDHNSMSDSPTDSTSSSNNIHSSNISLNGSILSNITIGSGSLRCSPHDNSSSKTCVTLQISNLDTTIDENDLKQYLINRLKPITSVVSIYFESLSVAKIRLPSDHQARQVIAYLHRKKIGHKRITVSFTRESSTLDQSTLRCQVAGLLKDIPNYKLSMYKFRELFQSRFKTSISVVDLHEMKDICTIIGNKNEEFITLRPELIDSIENSELMECFQHSVPYCTLHFVKTHRGWAEQEIDPLPNVHMTIPQVRDIIFALLKCHKSMIPISSIVHCIQADLNITLERNESGVNFEHLISCVHGVQITSNKFSIKILNWSNSNEASPKNRELITEDVVGNRYSKFGNTSDSFTQISREIVELIKLSPKATLKFSRFIPAYHNHFGKQCRVADYGYTKLIDLFEALSSVVQVIGEGENRQITLTHRVQMQRFKTDLLRILRTQSTKSILLSHMPMIYEQVQGRKFNITDYGVCDIDDILDALVNTNVVVVTPILHMRDTMISIPKRKQSTAEIEKTSHFAAEIIELFKHASQYTILFEKFACSYHYHFGYQCRLSDYGFLKLADLMEAIAGVVEMEFSNDEDRKIFLSPKTAQRIFSEQLKALIESYSGVCDTLTNLHEILIYHKKAYGYQIMPQTLGFNDMLTCIKSLPYIEVVSSNGLIGIKCHHDDQSFRQKSYAAVRLLLDDQQHMLPLTDFIQMFSNKYNDSIDEHIITAMKHAIEIHYANNMKCVRITKMMAFIVDLIDLIETNGTLKLQEIFNSLKLSIKSCYSFGYPNLSSFIQAFPDIFVFTLSKTNTPRSEVSLNTKCILCKNNNNNEPDAVDYNRRNEKVESFPNSGSRIPGIALIDLESSVQNSIHGKTKIIESSCPAFDEYSISYNDDFEIQYPMNSTCFIEPNEMFTVNREDVESSKNLSLQSDGKVDSIYNNTSQNIQSHLVKVDSISPLSTFYDDKSIATESKIALKRSFCAKDNNSNNKQKYIYKPDTPPTSPYWNNPVWGGEVTSPPINVQIKIPDLKVVYRAPLLNSPLVMANIAKKNKFT